MISVQAQDQLVLLACRHVDDDAEDKYDKQENLHHVACWKNEMLLMLCGASACPIYTQS